jgi:hypothetical protein
VVPEQFIPVGAGLAALRRFARPRPAVEQCELCSLGLPEEHDHLVELASRRLVCACQACAILFSNQGALKYRRVPRHVRFLADFHMTDVDWEALQLPVNMAFFVKTGEPPGLSRRSGVVAYYPSPGGATEATVPDDAWQMIVEDNPMLKKLEPDVEALLVNRVGQAREHYRVGVDECFKLVGLIRTHWRGFSGGQQAWDEIGKFFDRLKQLAGVVAHA